jgi:hypothetical protein
MVFEQTGEYFTTKSTKDTKKGTLLKTLTGSKYL